MKGLVIHIRIEMDLYQPFEKALEEVKNKYGEEFERINGLHKNNLNYTSFIDHFIDADNVAGATIDANANNSVKDVRTLLSEMSKPHTKLLSMNKIFYELSKRYGLDVAKEWLDAEWSGALYMHDSSSASFLPYCYAYELKKLVEDGLYFLPKTNTSPAKHLTTFAAHLRELIVWVSNRSSGACALPSFFIYSHYYWRKDVAENYYLKDPEYYRRQFFQQFLYEINQIHGRITQSAFTNIIIMDRNYISEIFGDRQYPDGSYVIDYVDEIIEHQKVFMEVVSEIRNEIMLTFPVLTYSLLFQDGKFVDEEFAKWCNRHNMQWYDSNFYIGDSVTNLSSCCRMTNDISKLDKQFLSSIGGSLTEIGSVKVSTINLHRIALESGGDQDLFMRVLEDRLRLNIKVLDCVYHIIKRNIEKGLLPNYSSKIINLENQSVTNGITAMYEAVETMGLIEMDGLGNLSYSDEGIAFAGAVMDRINEIQDSYNLGYSIGVEVIPGEAANIKLCQKDNLLTGRNDRYIYSNQWIPLIEKCTLDEKIKLGAVLDKKANGGQIMHVSLKGKFATEEQSWSLLNDIARQGVIYFAYNPKISVCKDNHAFFGEICPTCGEKKADEYSRVVGYLVKTNDYSSERKKEYYQRTWYSVD